METLTGEPAQLLIDRLTEHNLSFSFCELGRVATCQVIWEAWCTQPGSRRAPAMARVVPVAVQHQVAAPPDCPWLWLWASGGRASHLSWQWNRGSLHRPCHCFLPPQSVLNQPRFLS